MSTPKKVWCGLAPALLIALSLGLPATRAQDAKIELAARDVQGHELKVPVAGHPTLLVFVRTDQAQSQKALAEIRTLVKDRPGVLVAAVVSGEMSESNAGALAKDPQWTWPVLSDPDYQVSGKMKVCAWPTTMVVDAGGALVAHIGGYPSSFATDVAAHLDFAAGKIDQATRTQRTSAHEVVADSTDQKAARHLQVTQRLLEQAMPDAARAEFAKALQFNPTDPLLQLRAARLALALGDAPTAEALLAKISPQSVPAAQLNLVHGGIALQQEKWADAQRLLTAATQLNPDPAEAWYRLGLVYQHQQDWPHAAEAFRKACESTPAGRLLAPPAP